MSEPIAVVGAGWDVAVRLGRRVGHTIEAHEEIGSTNDRARELLDDPGGDGVAVVADEQTAGRGRRGRTWLSPPGVNLAVSVALRPWVTAADAWQLGLAAALATATACDEWGPVGLKWPNDIVAADSRKLAGLLIETLVDGDRLSGAVIGIGINVNWRRGDMPDEIRDEATSLADLAGQDVDRPAVLGRLLDALGDEIDFIEAGRSPLARYRERCVTLGHVVAVGIGEGTLDGRAVDLDPTGGLIVEAVDGRHVVTSGELVRVRERSTAR